MAVQWGDLQARMLPFRERYVQASNTIVYDNLSQGFEGLTTVASNSSSASSSKPPTLRRNSTDSALSSQSSCTTRSVQSSAYKRDRQYGIGEEECSDEQISDKMQSRKRLCRRAPERNGAQNLFACPYAKNEPVRYSAANLQEPGYRGCSQCRLRDISRVKQHLYRVHMRPLYYCPTCFKDYKRQDLFNAHVSSRSCSVQMCPFNEKMTPEQSVAVKKKVRGTDPYVNWYRLYEILFPGSQPPLSPYATFGGNEASLQDRFIQFVECQLPLRLTERLSREETFAASAQAVLDFLKKNLAPIMHDMRYDYQRGLSERSSLDLSQAPNPYDQEPSQHVSGQTSILLDSTEEHTMQPLQIILPARISQTAPRSSAQVAAVAARQINESDMEVVNERSFEYRKAENSRRTHQTSINEAEQYQDVISGPLTAIWSKEGLMSMVVEASDYFADFHQVTPRSTPNLYFEDDDQWIPTMVTAMR